MKVSAEMMYLGTESGTTRDGKTYVRAGLLQGLNSEVIYLNEENQKQVAAIKPMTPVICTLNISIGERTYVNLLDISPNPFNDSGKSAKQVASMDNLEYWQMAINIAFAGYLFLAFGVGCLIGHYIIYRTRG